MTEEKRPKVVVGAIIINSSNQILLVTQQKWKNLYAIPGGHVEWGEKLEDALRREIKEETDLDIDNIKFFNVDEYILGEENLAEKHYIFVNYICQTNLLTIKPGGEMSDYKWIDLREALTLPLVSNTKKLLEEYLRGHQK